MTLFVLGDICHGMPARIRGPILLGSSRAESRRVAASTQQKDSAVAVLVSERHAHTGPVVHHVPGLKLRVSWEGAVFVGR